MKSHLDGFVGFLNPDGPPETGSAYALMRQVQRTTHHVSLEIEQKDLPHLGRWMQQALAIAFLPDRTVRDPAFKILYHREKSADPTAALPVSADASRRKASHDRLLQERGIKVPPHLPPVVGEQEVELRTPREVARRALALLLVALRAESLGAGEPIPVEEMEERNPLGFSALSPEEKCFMESAEPAREQVVAMSWRYEALQALVWALGLAELPPASEICQVSEVVGLLLDHDEEELLERARLRADAELLDALDLHYRLHWSARQARLDRNDPPAGLLPGVLLERHYALNWLTCFEQAEWDEVNTPT